MSQNQQIITPFEVNVKDEQINYDAIINDFGSVPIDNKLLTRFEKLTGQSPHPFLKRGLYFSHRDFDKILDLYEKKKPFYIFTGRGPSKGEMHIGHMVPFIFTAYLQRIFDCPLVIQINDDEKYFWKDVKLDELSKLSDENIKEVLSFDFIPEKTFVFKNSEYIKYLYPTVCQIQKRVTFNQVKAIFGVTASSNIGKISFPAIQAAPSFSSSFTQLFSPLNKIHCLILCAIDQDPYFRMTRDVAPRMKMPKPALLHCKFIPGLLGVNSKMSASDPKTAIFLGDSEKMIKKKINRSVSGGQKTLELHKKIGADLSKDVAYNYLKFFMENDLELQKIEKDYKEGKILTSQVKNLLIETLIPILQKLKDRRLGITDEVVQKYKKIRKLNEK